MRWSGDADLVERTRAALSSGSLATVPGARCEGVEVHVEGAGEGAARVTVRRADQIVRYASHDPASLPSWIESWLLPDAEASPSSARTPDPTAPAPRAASPAPSDPQTGADPDATATEATATEATPEPIGDGEGDGGEPDDEGRVGTAREAAARAGTTAGTQRRRSAGVPWLGSLRLAGDLDSLAPAWVGGEIELAIGLGSSVWVSLAGAGAWSPEQRDTERKAIRVAGRVGYRHRFPIGLLRLGLGAGLVSASARREYDTADGQVVRTDEEAGPFAEVYTGLDLAMGRGWALSIACVLRGHVPDDAFDEGDVPGELRMPLADPSPLPVLAATLQIGLAFGLGDAW